MKINIAHIVGLVVINIIILLFERPGGLKGWRLYISMAVLTLVSAIAPLASFIILVPITVVNVLMNTDNIQKIIRGE